MAELLKKHVSSNEIDREWHLTKQQFERLGSFGGTTQEGVVPSAIIPMLTWVTPPGTSRSSGKRGMKARDTSFLYICVADNVWKRAPLEDSF
jgi:hypothetical protein